MEWISWILLLAIVVLMVFLFLRHMSSTHDTFKKLGIDGPKPSMLLGTFGTTMKLGMFEFQTKFYKEFKNKKAFGLYDVRTPVLVIKDLDMIRDVLVKNFNQFPDRRPFMADDEDLEASLLLLTGDRWKRVRSAVSPTFSSSRIKKMSVHIERNIQLLLKELRTKQEKNVEVDLSPTCYNFTLNFIATAVFGVQINSFEDPKNKFITEAQSVLKGSPALYVVSMLCPPLYKLLSKFGFKFIPEKSLRYFSQLADAAIEERKESQMAGNVNDFLDLVINAETEPGQEGARQLSRTEIHGQALVFFTAAYDSMATALSFTLFLLANHPEICRKLQDEIDRHLGKDTPNYDNVQSLVYLDMVINESLRVFPPGVYTERVSTEETVIDGIQIPKGMIILLPLYAIHTDPDIWEEPEKFDPERFSPENKAGRHPYAHLPFGQGPRNCIGMRLALMQLKMTVTSVLQHFDLSTCDKTVYPPRMMKYYFKAEDGLWVKPEARK